jgi:plastocyanin domain-containing protein
MNKTVLSIIFAGILIGGAIMLTRSGPSNTSSSIANVNNVSIVDGKQIITIDAKGGYQPEKSLAKAGVSTIIRFVTNGAFDCSSSIRIPSMGIYKTLPQTGNTDIEIGTPQVTTLNGTCGMGMFRFEVDFQG